MKRKEKIILLRRFQSGEKDIREFIIENSNPLPSWYWQQYETKEELLTDLKKTYGEKVAVVWDQGKPFLINTNPKTKTPKWFNHE